MRDAATAHVRHAIPETSVLMPSERATALTRLLALPLGRITATRRLLPRAPVPQDPVPCQSAGAAVACAGAVAAVRADTRYRVLEAVARPLGIVLPPEPGATIKQALLVDVQSTGLRTDQDAIIEVALLPIAYGAGDGRIFAVGAPLVALADPGVPLAPTVTLRTGITDAMVAGTALPVGEITTLADCADLIVAHHAAYDRPMLERIAPVFATKPWACSATGIPWAAAGYAATGLEHLTIAHAQRFLTGRRSADHVYAMLALLRTPVAPSVAPAIVGDAARAVAGRRPMALLLESARRPMILIWAPHTPYETRALLSQRDYSWFPGAGRVEKAWYKLVPVADRDAELAWLRATIYRGRCSSSLRAQVVGAKRRFRFVEPPPRPV